MTVAETILQKPTLVQRVIRARMVKLSIEDPAPDWNTYGSAAVQWWDDLMKESPEKSETKVAEAAIEWLRTHSVWGEILQ